MEVIRARPRSRVHEHKDELGHPRLTFPAPLGKIMLATWAFFLLASIAGGQEPAKPADSAPPGPVASRPTQAVRFLPVSREVIEARLQQFATTNAKRKSSLQRMFQEAGCTGERFREGKVEGSSLPNLVCTLPGETEVIILVGAHYDLAERGKGVVDNWTGAALLPSLLESLAGHARRHTFVFVGFTDEEKGLVGSKFYVSQLTPEEKQKIRAMVNLDTLGLSPTKVWVSRADRRLLTALADVARSMKLPLQGVDVDKVGSSDSESFAQQNIPAITIHSVTQETLPILHSPKDTPEAVKLDDYYQSYRLIAAYLSYLDTQRD